MNQNTSDGNWMMSLEIMWKVRDNWIWKLSMLCNHTGPPGQWKQNLQNMKKSCFPQSNIRASWEYLGSVFKAISNFRKRSLSRSWSVSILFHQQNTFQNVNVYINKSFWSFGPIKRPKRCFYPEQFFLGILHNFGCL